MEAPIAAPAACSSPSVAPASSAAPRPAPAGSVDRDSIRAATCCYVLLRAASSGARRRAQISVGSVASASFRSLPNAALLLSADRCCMWPRQLRRSFKAKAPLRGGAVHALGLPATGRDASRACRAVPWDMASMPGAALRRRAHVRRAFGPFATPARARRGVASVHGPRRQELHDHCSAPVSARPAAWRAA